MFNKVSLEDFAKMLTYSFADIGSDTLYNHLYKCIKNHILSGVLGAGSRLPSKRSLAKNLGISVITVESAYGQLVAEGYVYSLPKKGFFVADIKQTKHQQNAIFYYIASVRANLHLMWRSWRKTQACTLS